MNRYLAEHRDLDNDTKYLLSKIYSDIAIHLGPLFICNSNHQYKIETDAKSLIKKAFRIIPVEYHFRQHFSETDKRYKYIEASRAVIQSTIFSNWQDSFAQNGALNFSQEERSNFSVQELE